MRAIRTAVVTALGVGLVAGVAGCSQQASDDHQHGTTSVVASTDVWGSVASAVTGDHATVKSIVNSAVDDPHSFEASPADAAAITDASLVVYNGGGYDHWVDDVLASHQGVTDRQRLLAAARAPSRSPPTSTSSTTRQPPRPSPTRSPTASSRPMPRTPTTTGPTPPSSASRPTRSCRSSGRSARRIPARRWWRPNLSRTTCWSTPESPTRPREGFTSSIEEDADPSPADLAAMLDLINTHQVSALLYNPQTQTAVTKQIQDAAQHASIPIVDGHRDPPDGTDYLTWQRQTARAVGEPVG